MSFKLYNPIDDSIAGTFKRGDTLDLEAQYTIYVEPFTTCRIPHRIKVNVKGSVWLVRLPGIFMSHCLFVDCGPLPQGISVVTTDVFCFSEERTRIEKGFAISRLECL